MGTTKDNKFKFTNPTVRDACTGPAPGELNGAGKPLLEKLYWDSEIRGLCVRARASSKSFALWKNVRGKPRTITIGPFPEISVEQARARAKVLIGEIIGGVDPNERKRKDAARGVTLAQAIDMHATAMKSKGCAKRSIEQMRAEIDGHLADWRARPLAAITRNECAQRHERIATSSGDYAANHALRQFRACYNTANRRVEGLPPNPTVAVTFKKERRRQEPIAWEKLPAWRAAVDRIANPVRRDLQLFVLFTGLRATDAKTVRWEHVDFDAGTIHRPKPKGGADRAFTVPLSTPAMEILRQRHLENHLQFSDDCGWAFPTRDMTGAVTHVQELKEPRVEAGKRDGKLPSPHRLRDTFATAAHEAAVPWIDLKVLLNHALPGTTNVTAGYIRPSVEHLRACVDRVASFLLERMREGRRPAQDSARSSVG